MTAALGYSSGSVHRPWMGSDGMMHKMKLALVLACAWVLLSGILSPLLLGFGLASSLAVAWLAARADRRDREPVPLRATPRAPRPLPALARLGDRQGERRRLAPDPLPRLPIAPAARWLPAGQRSELGRVVYADSITLTPGTLSIDLRDGWVEVHALNEESLDALAGGLDMDGRVSRLEPELARPRPSASEPVSSGPPVSESSRSQPPISEPSRSGPSRPEPPASEPAP